MCGAVVLIVGHGLCSSGMFVAVDGIYQRRRSRAIVINKGYLVLNPVFRTLLFLVLIGNIPAPLRLNLFGEVLILRVGSVVGVYIVVLLGFIRFLRGCFNLYMYGGTQHGKVRGLIMSRVESGFLTRIVLFCH